MNSITLLSYCQSAGILLEARGDRLHIKAPAGSITPELRQELVDHKAELLAMYAIRARLSAIAGSLGIPQTLVDQLPPEELQATAEQAALCEGYKDKNGDPLTQSLLVLYLRDLAERVCA